MRSVPLSCLMLRMKYSLRRRTFRTASMSWMVPTSAPLKSAHFPKQQALPGTRLGYTVVPCNLVRGGMNLNEMWSRNRETRTNGVSYILQKGALAVFTTEGQQQIHDNLCIYKENASCFIEALNAAGIWYTGGKNSPYIWMKCPDGMSGWEFFDYLLREIQVVGIPGDGFGECGKGYFRFSTFGKPEETKEAANRLCKLLTKE